MLKIDKGMELFNFCKNANYIKHDHISGFFKRELRGAAMLWHWINI
jgi:hypothetical protein